MNMTKGQSNSAQQSQINSSQHQRNGNGRFGASQMAMRDNQQFGTIVHPSIVKTNNLMMESIVASGKHDGHQGGKKMAGLNNTTI